MNLARVRVLGRNDLRLVLRDRMLAVLLLAAFGMGLGCRYALPAIDASLAASGVMPASPEGMRFAETYSLFVAFIAFVAFIVSIAFMAFVAFMSFIGFTFFQPSTTLWRFKSMLR